MKLLFTSTPLLGHFHPLVPLAQAAAASGHEVAFATGSALAASLQRLGFRHFPAGPNSDETGPLAAPPARLSLSERRAWLDGAVHVDGRLPRMLPDVMKLCAVWQPDLVVREHLEFGGYLAAERLGLPHAAVRLWAAGHPDDRVRALAAALDPWRERLGLAPDPTMARLYPSLLVAGFPASLDGNDHVWPPTTRRVRPLLFDESGDERLPMEAERWRRPVVHASLGTLLDEPDLMETIADAFRAERWPAEPPTLVLTTGWGARSRERFRDRAGGALVVEPYIPYSRLLPLCDAVITHGGSGPICAALALGIPQVIIPRFGDHPENAQRCAELGTALVLQPGDVTAAALRDAVRQVLGDPRYRLAARSVQDEMRHLPGHLEAVRWLENLCEGRA
ncbi:MAG: glycosyltransferase [Chloroflexota bacterium]